MKMIVEIPRNYWMVWGVKIGNPNSTFENCFITEKEMTEKEIIKTIQEDYMEDGYIVTSAKLYSQETIKIDLLEKEIIV